MDGFGVRNAIFPAPEHDSNPLVSQRPYRRMVLFATGELPLVILARPLRLLDRVCCPFMKGLSQKTGIGFSAVCRSCVSTLPDDRSDACVSLHFTGPGEAIALGPKSCDQARHQSFPSSGQRIKNDKVRMRSGQFFNPFVTAADVLL